MSVIWPILRHALRHPWRIAAIDDRRKYTNAQIAGGALFIAEHLDAQTDNPHVGILLPTSGAFAMTLLGAWLARRVAVPLNYLLKPDELRCVIEDSGIDTIVSTAQMIDFVTDGASPIPEHVRVLPIEDCDFEGVPPLRWPPLPRRDDLAVILYTSGTSGKPKGVMLTHGNFRSNVDAAIEHARITRADTFLGVLPQFHSFGLTVLTLIPLCVGAKVVYSARFVPKQIVAMIREHRPDIVVAIPSMWGALLSVKDAQSSDFQSIRMAISGGEPLPEATFEAFEQRLDLRLLEGYGLTETAPATSWCTHSRFRRHSVGPALPGVDVRIVDEHDRPIGADREGEIVIAGPNIMKGYYHMPQETARVFVDLAMPTGNSADAHRRYFRTGDIGRIDADGFIYITGRKKEMLIVGGENVFPREIEEVLNQHESVVASAVIGKIDGVRGEVPIAFVELGEGLDFDDKALRAWCRDRLAGYKVPRKIRHIEKLPRNPTGKIMRRELQVE